MSDLVEQELKDLTFKLATELRNKSSFDIQKRLYKEFKSFRQAIIKEVSSTLNGLNFDEWLNKELSEVTE
jgi:hypothetical protein